MSQCLPTIPMITLKFILLASILDTPTFLNLYNLGPDDPKFNNNNIATTKSPKYRVISESKGNNSLCL
ncbi:hypothetical protein MTR_8g470130 [Medicago truncatula]|uniref:Transmembrane protein n=1 Tax=Medicago truncatula TaxID=3880 RepID=A0A072U2C4_MEDTR|nr:hypothetical protein MTR_8g470130 [Medicago truncatula]